MCSKGLQNHYDFAEEKLQCHGTEARCFLTANFRSLPLPLCHIGVNHVFFKGHIKQESDDSPDLQVDSSLSG